MMGGKGVGKSSLNRYLCNRLLPSCKSVLFVDLDPGQAEFTPAGCLSVSLITEPILGPNFCNLERTKVSSVFLGDANASNVRVAYLNAVSRLASCTSARIADSNVPVVINTMGFNRGLGLQLLSSSADAFSPTHIVSITSAHASKNYPAGFVASLSARSHLLHLPAIPETADSAMGASDLWGSPNPRALRDLVTSAYFAGQRISVRVRWTDILVECLSRDLPISQLLRALNQSLVALCRLQNESTSPFRELSNGIRLLSRPGLCDSECLGMAIVRHVNVSDKELLLTTTMSMDEVKGANVVSLGAIELPECLRYRSGKQVLLDRETENARHQQGRNPLAEVWQKSSRHK